MKDEMENIPIKEKNATSKAKVFEILNNRTEESTMANLRAKSLPRQSIIHIFSIL